MSFLSVLESESPASGLVVERCHINLWVLPGVIGPSRFVLDVGLELRATTDSVSEVELTLPCVTSGSIRDLSGELRDRSISQAVWGEPVRIVDGDGTSTIIFDKSNRSLLMRRIDEGECTHLDAVGATGGSHWRVALERELGAGESCYLRVRFDAVDMCRTWGWKRFLWLKNGARLDLRVNDIREASEVAEAGRIAGRILAIGDVYMFVICPWAFQLRAVSPALRYMRVLEGRVWERYLGRRPAIGGRKMLIYYWRWKPEEKSGEGITTHRPARAFLEVSRDPSYLGYGNVFVLALVAVFAAIATAVAFGEIHAPDVEWPSTQLVAWLAGGTGVAYLAFVREIRGLAWIPRAVRGLASKFDDLLHAIGR